jgi:polysaccharide biosynthesis PFTS motif protein
MKIVKFLPKVVTKFFEIKHQRKLRVVLRSYRKLKTQGRVSELHDLKGDLADAQFEKIKNKASKILFGASFQNASLALRQYTFTQLTLKGDFNMAVLYSIGSGKPIRTAIPKELQDILIEKGYKVDRTYCQLHFFLKLFLYFSFGIYRSLFIFKIFVTNENSSRNTVEPFTYFHQLSSSNVPNNLNGEISKNIITWYSQWHGRNLEVKSFHHDASHTNKVYFNNFKVYSNPITHINMGSLKAYLKFLIWFCAAIGICAKDIFLLRWWTFLLFEQYVQAAILRYADNSQIAKDYLLHHSGVYYRPLWTYEAEKRHSRVILYFYSNNNEQFKTKNGYINAGLGWKLSSWPTVLVWDKYQKDFITREFHSYNTIEIVGPIWFNSTQMEKKINFDFQGKKLCGVFDSQPFRISSAALWAPGSLYSESKIAIQFLKDIHSVLDDCSTVLMHKRKRDVGMILDQKYKIFLKTFTDNSCISLDPDLDADYIINNVDFVISMPFTSVAILAQNQNKPSIYYDPFGDVQRDDRAAHGIKIIIGLDELRYWVESTMAELRKLEGVKHE